MRRKFLIFLMTGVLSSCGVVVATSSSGHAVAATTALLTEIQTGADNANNEYIELYNPLDADLDISDWQLQYLSASGNTVTSLISLTGHLKAKSYGLIANEHAATGATIHPDMVFADSASGSGVLALSAGHVRLIDAHASLVDCVSWGSSAVQISGCDRVSGSLSATSSYQRLQTGGVYDRTTGVVKQTPMTLQFGGWIAPPPIQTDVCSNIAGQQISLPAGYGLDSQGLCQPDMCVNLPGLQLTVPEAYESFDGVTCSLKPLEAATILITELLPNAAGSDAGNEYIELYNPNDRTVDLTGYTLHIGPNFEASYTLPSHREIGSHQYLTLTNTELGFTLVNTSSRVQLTASAGNIVSTTDSYSSPADDEAWALINGTWQYTNRPTPAAPNAVSTIPVTESEEVIPLAPCPAGKYRNPLTNRCRTNESAVILTPCDEDQYRNPATGRCRKLALNPNSLTPCQAGYDRNPATNRCRKVTTASADLKPCDPGQERNPETNRCRKTAEADNPGAKVAVVGPSKEQLAASTIQWWALGIVSTGAAGYGVFEWRHELSAIAQHVGVLLRLKK